jgi:hypothetical protein
MRFLFNVLWIVVYVGAGIFMEDVIEVQSYLAYYSVGAVMGLGLMAGLMELE